MPPLTPGRLTLAPALKVLFGAEWRLVAEATPSSVPRGADTDLPAADLPAGAGEDSEAGAVVVG